MPLPLSPFLVAPAADAWDAWVRWRDGGQLRDLTVGVVGTGRIGTAVIDRLRGFGARILAYDTRPKTSSHGIASVASTE